MPVGTRALLLVRNGVEHDARVLRSAKVLLGLGAEVLVIGASTATAPAGPTTIEGVDVVRVPGSLRTAGASLGGHRVGGAEAVSPSGTDTRGTDETAVVAPAVLTIAPAPGATAPIGSAAAGTVPSWTARAAARRTVRATAYARGAMAIARTWRPTLVHANDHNTMWPALAIRRLCGARVLYDSHELWADRNGRPEWRPGLLADEALFVRTADALITASPGYSDALAARHGIRTPRAVRNIPEGNAAAGDAKPCAPPHVVYVGGLMRGRGLELTIDALALAPGVSFRIVGPGPSSYIAALEARARAAGVSDRVVLAGAVPPDQVVGAAAGATLGLALIEPICRSYELTLPNKLFEYVRASIPVLSSPVPVLAGVVRDHGLGLVVASLAVEDVARAIREGTEPSTQARMRRAAARYAADNTWDGEARVLAAAYLSAVGPDQASHTARRPTRE